jgi:hypothetical protein
MGTPLQSTFVKPSIVRALDHPVRSLHIEKASGFHLVQLPNSKGYEHHLIFRDQLKTNPFFSTHHYLGSRILSPDEEPMSFVTDGILHLKAALEPGE